MGASFVAAFVSVPAAALCFVGVYAVGGLTEVPLDTVLAAMVGVHVVIGIGEAVITAATIGSVLAVRPDLVYGARSLLPSTVAARRCCKSRLCREKGTAVKTRTVALVGIGLLIPLLLAAVVSFYASSSPDALEQDGERHRLQCGAEGPRSGGFAVRGLRHTRCRRRPHVHRMAGTVGVLATFVVAGGLFFVVKRHKSSP